MNLIASSLLILPSLMILSELPKFSNFLKNRSSDDQKVASLSEQSATILNKIEMLNQSLLSLSATCPAAGAHPAALTAIASAGHAIAQRQQIYHLSLNTLLLEAERRFSATIPATQRLPPLACQVPGPLKFNATPLFRIYNKHSGSHITLAQPKAQWRYFNEKVRVP